jgi:hypothetical protein
MILEGRLKGHAGVIMGKPPFNSASRRKALEKLLNNKIAYKPFTIYKETPGEKGNYWKLIYNMPRQ